MKRFLTHIVAMLGFLWFLSGCGKNENCAWTIGLTDFSIDPNSALYSGLNVVGGHMYLTGGARGVIVVRTAYDHFVAFECSCPLDGAAVEITADWGASLLECPECHSLFIAETDGMPMDGSATTCPLYQYNTSYNGGILYVY